MNRKLGDQNPLTVHESVRNQMKTGKWNDRIAKTADAEENNGGLHHAAAAS